MSDEHHENEHGQIELPGGHSLEEYYYAQKISFQDVLEHITGPVVSIIVHVIALALLCTIMIFQPPENKKDLIVEVKEVELKALDKLPEPPPPPEDATVDERPDTSDRPAATTQQGVNVDMSDVSVSSGASVEISLPDVLAIKPSSSALKLSGVFSNRSGSGRVEALKRYSNTTATEGYVKKALTWLANKQNDDGSWGENAGRQPAFTALAILTFLAHGETPQSQDYGPVVLRGLKKLIEYSDTVGANGVINNGGNGYGHAMVAYALSEGYALTKIPMLEKAMNKMVKTVVAGQNDKGSYNYNFNNAPGKVDPKTGKVQEGYKLGEPRCDLSVGGWNFQALKAGFAAGSNVQGLEAAMEKGIQAIEKVHGCKDGGFSYGYGADHGSFTITSVGTLCLQLMGAGKGKAAQGGMKWIESFKAKKEGNKEGVELDMDWKNPPSMWALYGWYYMTQALFQGHSGTGNAWRKWNSEFTKCLMKEQEREGYWRTPIDKYAKENFGHGESFRSPGVNAETKKPIEPVFTEIESQLWATCMCTLMLEVYYRYLPTFKVVGGHGGDAPEDKKKDDEDLSL